MKPPRYLRHGESVKNIVDAWNTLVRYVRSITPRNGGTDVMVRTTPGGTTFETRVRSRTLSEAGMAVPVPEDFRCSLVHTGGVWKVIVAEGRIFVPGDSAYVLSETELEISGDCFVAVNFDLGELSPSVALYGSLDIQPEAQLRLWLVQIRRDGGGNGAFRINRIFHKGSFWWF